MFPFFAENASGRINGFEKRRDRSYQISIADKGSHEADINPIFGFLLKLHDGAPALSPGRKRCRADRPQKP
jgi:hypothetical protein